MTTTTVKQRKLALFAWMSVCVLWGTTYLAIRVTLESMPALLMAGIRWTIAGSLIAAYLYSRGERLPARRAWQRKHLDAAHEHIDVVQV